MVLLLSIHCLLLLPLFVEVCVGPCFFLFSTFCPSSFAITSLAKCRAGCLTVIVLLISCDCYYYVALLHGAVGWSLACDGGIS